MTETNKLNLIQCGVGGMGKAWWNNATKDSPHFELVAIADIADAPLAEAGDALNIPPKRRFKSLKQALKKVQADAVLTVTPPAIHVQHAKLAFDHGLHLITEKPIADNLKNAKLMVERARQANKQLLVTQNYRFHPPMQTLKRLMQEKPVGELGHGHIDFYIAADFTGSFRETMEYPLLVDMAIHHFDLIRSITGRNIARVMVQSHKPAWSWYQHDPMLKMLMELEDGTPFSYSGDWSGLGKQTGWNGAWRLQCAHGCITYEKDEVTVWRSEKWAKDQTPAKVSVEEAAQNPQAKLLADFARAIRIGKPAETNGADNLHSFATVIAGVLSAKKRKWIDVNDLL
jgi:predicted dehydrogenase